MNSLRNIRRNSCERGRGFHYLRLFFGYKCGKVRRDLYFKAIIFSLVVGIHLNASKLSIDNR